MIRTERLLLRIPTDEDRASLRAMLSDAEVMRDLFRDPTPEGADHTLAQHEAYRRDHGLGFWAVEADGVVAGMCGLKPGASGTPAEGELEIGWLLDRPFWGRGIAREAAEASLAWAWENRDAPRVLAITAISHVRSQRLMERIGMVRLIDGNFVHPGFAPDDPMRHSVTFAVNRPMVVNRSAIDRL